MATDDAWLKEYEDRIERECQGARATINKQLRNLKRLGVASIHLSYDGCGDSGVIEEVKAFGVDETLLEIPEKLEKALIAAGEILLPSGWENNDGAFGDLVLDVAQGRLVRQHNWRVQASEYEEEAWEL